jgi:hypothetical protein
VPGTGDGHPTKACNQPWPVRLCENGVNLNRDLSRTKYQHLRRYSSQRCIFRARYSSPNERFEVDSANAARDFLRGHGISQQEIDTVWTAIALHTTPDIPPHMHPVIALVTAGVEMDVLGIAYSEFSDAEREAVVQCIRVATALRKTSFRLSTTASITSRTPLSATSTRTFWPTRTRNSSA